MKPRVAVVGAGWAGLAAAVELAGWADLTVYEAGRDPGGRARCAGKDGARFDNGQHILLGAYAECLRLMRTVGVSPESAVRRLPMQWLRDGGLRLRCPQLPAPLHVAAGLLLARGVSWTDKWKLARALDGLRRSGYCLEHDLSVDAWLAEQGQSAALRRDFWQPLVASALNTPLPRASMRVLAAVLRDSLGAAREASDLLLPALDLSALFPDPAWRWLGERGAALRAGERVASVEMKDGRPEVDGAEYDAVIVAVAPYHAKALLAEPALRESVAAYRYCAIATVYVRFDRSPRLPAPMMGVSGGTGDWLFDREALCGEAGWLAAVISAPAALPPARELVHAVSADARRLAPWLGEPCQSQVIVEKRATFASEIGLSRPDTRTAWPGVYLAGDWVHPDYPATLEGAARSGVAAAAAVKRDLQVEQ